MEAYRASLLRASVPVGGSVSRLKTFLGRDVSGLFFSFTFWKHSRWVKQGDEDFTSFSSLGARLRYEAKTSLGQKKNAPMWAPIASQGRAYDQDVTRVSALVLDYDAGSIDLMTVAEHLRTLDIAFLLHDSPSSSHAHPKWRLVLPLSQPVLPHFWKQTYLAAAHLWGEALLPTGETFDLSCHNPAHRWFYPWRTDPKQAARRVLSHEGKTFDLERFSAQLQHPVAPEKITHVTPSTTANMATERARRYLRAMDPGISGQGGHNQTFRAARILVKDFALDASTAFDLLWQEFNPRCRPSWTEKELRHKVNDAVQLQVIPGRLLDVDKRLPKKVKTPATPPKKGPLLVHEAELLLQHELLASDLRDQVITVLQVPCGGGKSHAARQVAKLLQLLRAQEDHGKTAFLGPTHQWAEEMFARALVAGLDPARFFSPPGEGGRRALLPENSPQGSKAPLLCQLSRSALAAHYAAGWQGQEICYLCPFRDGCLSKLGRVGPGNTRFAIATHQNPKAAIQDARRIWVDEWPELLESRSTKKEALRILKKGLESLGPKSQKAIARAADSVLSWLSAGADETVDPLTDHRAALKALCDDGRAKLKRTPDHDPHQRNEEIGAARDVEAWKAATWLLESALYDAKLFATSEKEPAFHLETPIAQVLKEAKRAVILSATPRDMQELERVTGKKVQLVILPVEGTAKRELTHLKTRSATRRSYLENGRLRLTRKHTRNGQVKTEVAPLISDLNAVAKHLRQRPDLHSVFLATFRPIAAALRLTFWAGQGGGEADRAYWEELYGSAKAAQEALTTFQTAIAPLLQLVKERNLVFAVGHYGALEGLDGFKEADAFLTVGDPNVNVDDHKRRYMKVRGLSLAQLAEEEAAAKWQVQYDQEAASELCQAHGRDRWPTRTRAVVHLHIGATVPMGWPEDIETELRVGRPCNESNQAGAQLVAAVVEKLGGARAAARVLEVPWQTFQRYASGERAVPVELVEKIRSRYPWLRGGSESPIPARLSTVLIGESGPLASPSLNRGIGATPKSRSRVLIGELDPPQQGWLAPKQRESAPPG